MDDKDLNSIFEEINKLKKPDLELKEKNINDSKDSLQRVLNDVLEEIQRLLNENNLTQEDLCKITKMSQSNVSKIQNGKVIPRIETLQKIAMATHTRLVISFESIERE